MTTWLLSPLVAVALLLAPAGDVRAQDLKPAVVVSIASPDNVLSDIGYLTRAAGVPEIGGLVTLFAGQYTQGIDAKKPAGLYVTFVDDQPVSVGFVAVRNLDVVLGNLRDQVGEPEDAGDGVLELASDRPQSLFLKEQDGWAFLSNEKASLANLPKDPSTLLGDLTTRYDIAVQVQVRNIPGHLREMAMVELKRGFEQTLQQRVEGEEDRQLAEGLGRNYLESMTQLIQGAEEVTLGLNVDQEGARTYFDFSMTAIEDSELAKQMAMLSGVKSRHSGFLLPEAAANLHFSSRLSERDIEQTLLVLESMREEAMREIAKDNDLKTPEAKEQARQVVSTFLSVAEETIKEGVVNGGAVLLLDGDALNVAAGGTVSDGKKVEEGFRQLVELAKSEPDFPGVEFNAATHAGVTFHTMSVPIPEEEGEARKVFGPRLDVALGIAPQNVYVGFGKQNMDLLKRVIDASAREDVPELPPFQLIVSIAPVIGFAASIDDANPLLTQLANAAKTVSDNDSISLTATLIERGVQYRFEIQEGVLQIIGRAAQMARQQQGAF